MNSKVNVSGGLGLPSALFLVFLVLKLTNTIDWSWWWVTCPLWAIPGIFLVVALVALFVGCLAAISPRGRL